MTAFWSSSRIAKSDEPAPTRKLRNLAISEVSVVDSGANQHAMITLFKRDTPAELELPEEYDSRSFNASGKGPMHTQLFTMYDDYRRAMASPDSAFRAAWNDLTPDQKEQIRSEERAHASAVAAAAEAERKQREREMNKLSDDQILVKAAHAVAAGKLENTVRATTWHGALRKMAAERQEDGETVEQAYARLVKTNDPDAKALFRASLGGVADDAPAAPVAPVIKADSALGQFRKVADDFRAADPAMSRLMAFEKAILAQPTLWAAAKAEA